MQFQKTRVKLEEQIPGVYPRFFYKTVEWSDEYGTYTKRAQCDIEEAEVVSSEIGGGAHCPVLDIDVPAYLVPSSTPGHSHLYIDQPISWRRYKRLLRALARSGLVEKGYVRASIKRKGTHVRVPWFKKGEVT